jgi:hypothetical protein
MVSSDEKHMLEFLLQDAHRGGEGFQRVRNIAGHNERVGLVHAG